jgi:acetyl esterase/lipase
MMRIAFGDDAEQFGDLRLPDGAGPHPVAIVLHGGFWRAAHDLEHLGPVCEALTTLGIATFNVEYRRVGHRGGEWPASLRDVVAAMRRLDGMPELDPARRVLVGFSAGGQLAVRAAHEDPGLCGVVSLAGLLDLRAGAALGLGRDAVQALLGGTPAEVPARYADASPIEQGPLAVRQIIVHGDRDELVPCSMSADYVAAAAARGDRAELREIAGAGHFELIDPASAAWPAVVAAVRDVIGH